MRTIALVSGGKDSILSMLVAARYGHTPIVLANLIPDSAAEACDVEASHEIDSYMYQTVGHEVVQQMADCLQLPLRRASVRRGRAVDQSLHYTDSPDAEDEVEALYTLLRAIKAEFPEAGAVTSGAIQSNYQRNRVEHVCHRLGLVSLAFLWQRPAQEILDMAAALHVHAVLVKTASIGLAPRALLGCTLQEARPTLECLAKRYGLHMAGEGGEFETIVLDCPFFYEYHLVKTGQRNVIVDDNAYAPSGHCILSVELRRKLEAEKASDAALRQALPHMTFASDRMAALPSYGALCEVVEHAVTDEQAAAHDGNAIACLEGDALTGQSSMSAHLPGCVVRELNVDCSVLTSVTVKRRAMQEIMERLQCELRVAQLACYACDIVMPDDVELRAALNVAYESAVPMVCPPCQRCIVSGDNRHMLQLTAFCVPLGEVTDKDSAADNRVRVLHAQSRSCWAAAIAGPYAQASQACLPNGATHLRTILVLGLEPTRCELACLADVARCGEGDTVATTAAHNFAAEFAFSYANAAAYLQFYHKTIADVTRIHFYLIDRHHTRFLKALWQCCAGCDLSIFNHDVFLVTELTMGAMTRHDMSCAAPSVAIALELYIAPRLE